MGNEYMFWWGGGWHLRRRMMSGKRKEWDYELYPEEPDADGAGYIRCKWVPVKAGQTVTINYFATKQIGYIYDARSKVPGNGCGLQYLGWPVGTEYEGICGSDEKITLEPSVDGYVHIAGFSGSVVTSATKDGEFAINSKDIPYCKYIKVKVEVDS